MASIETSFYATCKKYGISPSEAILHILRDPECTPFGAAADRASPPLPALPQRPHARRAARSRASSRTPHPPPRPPRVAG